MCQKKDLRRWEGGQEEREEGNKMGKKQDSWKEEEKEGIQEIEKMNEMESEQKGGREREGRKQARILKKPGKVLQNVVLKVLK